MALRFIEGFDHYTAAADALTKWTNFITTSSNINSSAGRFGNGLDLVNDSRGIYKDLDDRATWIVGCAFRTTDGFGNMGPIISFQDAASQQVECRISSLGFLQASRAGTVLATGTTRLDIGPWYYVEFKATIHDSTGIAVVRVNGITEINLSGVDTQNTANATASRIQFFGGGGTGTHPDLDDVYICDSSGGVNNDFLGDLRVDSLFPNGNGNTSQLVGQDANSTDNYLNVDEAAPDSDTTYNESSTVNDKDTYAYTNLVSTIGTVHGVQILPYARKTDAGVRSIKSIARHSATEVDSADFTLSTTYQYFEDLRETKPGGGAWSISDVNGAEFGVKVSA